jgi:hypothetical protein
MPLAVASCMLHAGWCWCWRNTAQHPGRSSGSGKQDLWQRAEAGRSPTAPLPALTLMCLVISVTSESLSSAASSMPPIWLYTNRLDSSTAREKIWVLYWVVCRHTDHGQVSCILITRPLCARSDGAIRSGLCYAMPCPCIMGCWSMLAAAHACTRNCKAHAMLCVGMRWHGKMQRAACS